MNEKKDKYSRQKRYAKKLNERTVKLLLRLYIGQDDDIINYLNTVDDKSVFIKKTLRRTIKRKKKKEDIV